MPSLASAKLYQIFQLPRVPGLRNSYKITYNDVADRERFLPIFFTGNKAVTGKLQLDLALPLRCVLILRMAVSAFSLSRCSTTFRSWTMMRCDIRKTTSTVTTRACWQKRQLDSWPKWSITSRSLSRQVSISLSWRDIRSLLVSFFTGREIWKNKIFVKFIYQHAIK